MKKKPFLSKEKNDENFEIKLVLNPIDIVYLHSNAQIVVIFIARLQ